MKLSKENITFKKVNENIYEILCQEQQIKFNTPKILIPFGIEDYYGKSIIKFELNEIKQEKNKETIEYKKQTQLYKIIKNTEKYLSELLDLKEGELKSVIRERENQSSIIECRLKNMKKHIMVDITYQNPEENYLKTIWDIQNQTYANLFLEIYGYWDYRQENKVEKNKVGLLIYIRSIHIF